MILHPRRNRIVSAGLVAIAAWFGVHARHYGDVLPDFVAGYAPEVLWAMAVFATIGLIFPAAASWQVAAAAYVFTTLFEFSQLYHEPWIDALRGTPLGTLALGSDFLIPDLTCYAVGVLLGLLIELWTLN
jgi:Protein of unknown function (DUF2809)